MKLSPTFQRVLQVLSSPGVSFAPSPALDSIAIEAPATSDVDVAIVGGGLSGLSAARALTAANKTVIVLEARDRVGGRVENHELSNGGITELGAAFVGPTQDRVLNLASELNLETFPEYDQGDNVNWSDNERSTHASNSPLPPYGRQPQNTFIVSVPAYSRIALHQLNVIFAALDRRAAELDISAPWAHPKAAEWDAMTFGSCLLSDQWHWQARRLVDTITNALFSANPSELSYLYVLTYIASAGNETMTGIIERLVGVKDGGQESRIVGGTGLLATRMAEELGHSRILLNSPVQTISYNDSTSLYTVSSTGHTIMTKQVIVAMSPPLAARITYSPPLPASRDQLTQRMFMGSLGKAIAVYPTPFWRKSNLTGQALSDTGAGSKGDIGFVNTEL